MQYDFDEVGVCSTCGGFGEWGLHCLSCNEYMDIILPYRYIKGKGFCVISEQSLPKYKHKVSEFTRFLFEVARTDPIITVDYRNWVVDVQYRLLQIDIFDLNSLETNLVNLNKLLHEKGYVGLHENTIGVMMFLFEKKCQQANL